jgi:hypothetical protein
MPKDQNRLLINAAKTHVANDSLISVLIELIASSISPLSKNIVYRNDARLGDAVLERNATHLLSAPIAIAITPGFTTCLCGPRRLHNSRFCFPDGCYAAN